MSKQTFSILVLMVAVLIIGYLAFGVHDKVEYDDVQIEQVSKPAFDNMTFRIPDTDIEVRVYETVGPNDSVGFFGNFTDPSDESSFGSISVIDKYMTNISTDGSKIVVPIVVDYGGSGQFVYMAYISRLGEIYVYNNAVFIGDRITIDNIEVLPISSNTAGPEAVIVYYKERTADQSFVDTPVLDSEILLQVREGELREEKRVVNASFDEVRMKEINAYSDVPNKFVIHGEVPGPWYFEASFPVLIENENGEVLHQTYATAQEEWMTTDFVPFESLIILPKDLKGIFKLVLKNDNPSGMAELDKRFEMYLTAK